MHGFPAALTSFTGQIARCVRWLLDEHERRVFRALSVFPAGFMLAAAEPRDKSLGRQLRDSVRTGSACRYHPDPARPVIWMLDS